MLHVFAFVCLCVGSSRRRHTRCALVTGVQTCALPIYPPTHTIHRSLMSRVFTPRKVAALEPQIREFCANALDPFVGSGELDFIEDLGKQMPMRVIGMLLGVPERSEEHTSELQSLMRISYAVFCLKKKNTTQNKRI